MTEQTTSDWFDPTETTFGDRLAGAREASGMTQGALAKRLGVKKKTLDNWEHDQAEPRASSLSMLAGLLNVSLTWLLTGEGDGPSGPEGGEMSTHANQLMNELREISTQLTLAAERLGRAEAELTKLLRDTSDE
ncbi:helix-turn-helix domain-containing protein [Roseovarius sp. LXJ103]|uniref:helix-turn-helix domain-containing protein n=1 Tax=Roseovarius carneus TaxID=2853164 RepID=UPI000D60488F|nr:helix-turn-helix transcriptional regulator [Roseovarius carneus]MBZ8118703.1 helix-turn-helix domain-containing protein [Roseovarius carneus]PWE35618.1 transcriptional regulator [Pelagicola sp. LXJ1103]